MVCLSNICVDTLHKGDTENNDDDDDNNNNNNNNLGASRREKQQTKYTFDPHGPITWTFPISSTTAECSVTVVQTAAKCDTQHRSASCCSNVMT